MIVHLSNNIRTLRREKQISQEKLAVALSISRNKIASYEGKGVEPNLSLLLKFSSYFQISIEDLLRTELDQNNIERARAAYLSGSRLVGPHQTAIGTLADRRDDAMNSISEFIDRNEQAEQMLEGFKVFYKMKSQKSPVKEEIKNLFLILENVIEANKTFVDRIVP